MELNQKRRRRRMGNEKSDTHKFKSCLLREREREREKVSSKGLFDHFAAEQLKRKKKYRPGMAAYLVYLACLPACLPACLLFMLCQHLIT